MRKVVTRIETRIEETTEYYDDEQKAPAPVKQKSAPILCSKPPDAPMYIIDSILQLARSGRYTRRQIVRNLPYGYRTKYAYDTVKAVCDEHGLLIGNLNQHSPAVKQIHRHR